MTKYLPILCLALASALFPVSSALAQSGPVLIGEFGKWKAYSHQEGAARVCFMAASPTKDEGKYSKRGKIYAMITHRPGENSRDVFSYFAGYSYKSGSPVSLSVNGRKFALVGNGENAWTPTDQMDRDLSESIRKGSTMIVEGASSRGTKTKDTFSLKGSGDAYAAINKACGL